jgi:hypothetical protein
MPRVLSRRDFVSLAGSGLAAAVIPRFGRKQPAMSALAALDHLIVGVADLEAGMNWFAQRTGVRPAVGGVHPGRGTRNALLGLGGRKYLEILSIDPAQDSSKRSGLLAFTEPRLIGWAAASSNITDLAGRVKSAGVAAAALRPGSRTRPDGAQLKWTTLAIETNLAHGEIDPIPFFIQWDAESRHPAEDSPKGCEVTSFEFEHPDPETLRKTLSRVGIEAAVRKAAAMKLHARLRTPKGELSLE